MGLSMIFPAISILRYSSYKGDHATRSRTANHCSKDSKMDFFTIYLFAAVCAASTSASDKIKCVMGYLNSCGEHQKCVGISVGGRAGYCDCMEGYIDVEDELGRQVSVVSGSTKFGDASENESKISFILSAIFREGLCLQELDRDLHTTIIGGG